MYFVSQINEYLIVSDMNFPVYRIIYLRIIHIRLFKAGSGMFINKYPHYVYKLEPYDIKTMRYKRKQAKQREWRMKNKERTVKVHKEFVKNNREHINNYQKLYAREVRKVNK